jgi:DUF971 family protein
MNAQAKPWPTELRIRDNGDILAVSFDTDESFDLPAEYLRVESPSAEVKGHGPGQETLVAGKVLVKILSVEPVGNYAVKIQFTDRHSSGIYSWDYLHKLGMEYKEIWAAYLQKLEDEGKSRGG